VISASQRTASCCKRTSGVSGVYVSFRKQSQCVRLIKCYSAYSAIASLPLNRESILRNTVSTACYQSYATSASSSTCLARVTSSSAVVTVARILVRLRKKTDEDIQSKSSSLLRSHYVYRNYLNFDLAHSAAVHLPKFQHRGHLVTMKTNVLRWHLPFALLLDR
jgi:hypothetical protein